jgi:hypothetical protein
VQVRFSRRLHQEFLHGSARQNMDLHGHDVDPRPGQSGGREVLPPPMQRGAADQQHAVSEQHQRSDPMVRQGVGEEIGCTDSEEQGS